MKKVLSLLAGISALVVPATVQAQTVQINYGATAPIPALNDFQGQLAGLGLVNFTTMGATIILSANATIFFEFLGSESQFNDTFTAGAASLTENTGFTNNFPGGVAIGPAQSFNAGSLAGLLNFTTTNANGASATVGQDGFGIFLGANQLSGQSFSVFYLGFDDQVRGQDDNHDDFIVRATVRSAVPEPTTWAMMLIGFAGVGYSMRRRRRTAWIRQAA